MRLGLHKWFWLFVLLRTEGSSRARAFAFVSIPGQRRIVVLLFLPTTNTSARLHASRRQRVCCSTVYIAVARSFCFTLLGVANRSFPAVFFSFPLICCRTESLKLDSQACNHSHITLDCTVLEALLSSADWLAGWLAAGTGARVASVSSVDGVGGRL